MKWSLTLLPLLAAVVPTLAQDDGNEVSEYAQTVLNALEEAGLTTLASALELLSTTPGGAEFFEELEDGDKTVFAPTNEAFTAGGFPENFTAESSEEAVTGLGEVLLTQLVQYHIVDSDVTDDEIGVTPATTVVDTLVLGGVEGSSIRYGDNDSVPLILTRESEDAEGFSIFNNGEPIAVNGEPTEVGNLQIYTIDQVIPLPPSLAELAESAALTQLATVLTDAGLLEALNSSSGGLTIFAPNDAAFEAIASDLEGLDEETVAVVLQNHVVNGTVAFSDDIDDEDDTDSDDDDQVTPLAGEVFTFSVNDTGIFVTSGNATAEIVGTDYLFNGGVVHVIDAVLVNADAEVNEPSPTNGGGGGGTSPSSTTSGGGGGGGAETSTPAGEDNDAGNPAGKVQVNWATLGLGGVIVSLGAIVGGGVVAL